MILYLGSSYDIAGTLIVIKTIDIRNKQTLFCMAPNILSSGPSDLNDQ
jgi:hypothetical protein